MDHYSLSIALKRFKDDFFKKTRCKNDMCNLCCISSDTKNKPFLAEKSVNTCYERCAKSNNIFYNISRAL